jgi:hypothetical protein
VHAIPAKRAEPHQRGSAKPSASASCFSSALKRDDASESRIREALLSSFDVPLKAVCKSRVSGNRDDEVVPAKELIQRQHVFKRPLCGRL